MIDNIYNNFYDPDPYVDQYGCCTPYPYYAQQYNQKPVSSYPIYTDGYPSFTNLTPSVILYHKEEGMATDGKSFTATFFSKENKLQIKTTGCPEYSVFNSFPVQAETMVLILAQEIESFWGLVRKETFNTSTT